MSIEITVQGRRVRLRESYYSDGKRAYRQIGTYAVGECLADVPDEVKEQVQERLASIAAENADRIVQEAVSGMDAAAVVIDMVADLEPLRASTARLSDSLGVVSGTVAQPAEHVKEAAPKAVDADELIRWMRRFGSAAENMGADTKKRIVAEAQALAKAMTTAPAPKPAQTDDDPFGDLMPTTAPKSTSKTDMITATKVDDIDSYVLSDAMRSQLSTAFRNTDIDALLTDWKDEEGYRHVGKDNAELDVAFRHYVYGNIRQQHIAAIGTRDHEDVAAEITFVVGRTIAAGHITRYLAINKYEQAAWHPVSDSTEQDVAAFAARVGNGHMTSRATAS